MQNREFSLSLIYTRLSDILFETQYLFAGGFFFSVILNLSLDVFLSHRVCGSGVL